MFAKRLSPTRSAPYQSVAAEPVVTPPSEADDDAHPEPTYSRPEKPAFAWNEPPAKDFAEEQYFKAVERELEQLRDEVGTLRHEFAALREEMRGQVGQIRASQHMSPLYSDAMQMAMLGRSKTTLRAELENLLAEHENFRFEPYRGLSTAYVVDTMQTVFHYFFKTRDFEDCIVRTVNQGGDADTTGAIAGMLAGAYYGIEGLPKRWLKKMDRNLLDEVTALSRRLVELSPHFR